MRRGGLILEHDWKSWEIDKLFTSYSDKDKPVGLSSLAKELRRNKANVCRKARSLGLTNQRRRKVEERKPTKRFATVEELMAYRSKAAKERIAKFGHPRGYLGRKHSEDAKRKISEASRKKWRDPKSKLNSVEMAQMRSDAMIKRIAAGNMRSGYSRTRGGKRDDLGGVYFRSSWEANYARYLRFLVQKGEIKSWKFEAKTFVFEEIKRGTRAYTPDFLIETNEGSFEWHEVKGWMDDKSKIRISRFRKYFPSEKLVIVDATWFKAANRSIGKLIAGWESGTVHV